jgi:hypothetical protein
MAIRNHLTALVIAGSLLSAALTKPLDVRFSDDTDDTPLPVVIWHGKFGSVSANVGDVFGC